jgi:hypothetical protein
MSQSVYIAVHFSRQDSCFFLFRARSGRGKKDVEGAVRTPNVQIASQH